ncbi:uncharacterized protein METZ01_LOCUS109101, partial [marine metagenome]
VAGGVGLERETHLHSFVGFVFVSAFGG